MRYPLDQVYITGQFLEPAVPGTGIKDAQGIARHIGVDFRAAVGMPVYAPDLGAVTASYTATSGNQVVEVHIGNYAWRFLHLSERAVKVGDNVLPGQILGKSGNSGGVAPHLHVDVRRYGTAWDDSLSNYINPLSLLPKIVTSAAAKEETEMLTQTGAEVLHRFLLGEPPSDYTLKNRVGKMTFDQAYQDIKNTDRYKQHAAEVKKATQEVVSHLPVDMR